MASCHSTLKKSIVHFGKFYFPEVGGIEAVTVSTAEGAAKVGYDVSVVCFNSKHSSPTRETINGVHVERAKLSVSVASQPLSLGYMFKALATAWRRSIVHLHAPNMLAAVCSILLPRSACLLVHWHGDVRNKGVLGQLIRPIERRLLNRADCIVATSAIYASTSEALQPFKSKIRIVPIGIPDPEHIVVNDRAEEIRQKRLIEDRIRGRKIVLSVGRLVPFKGFDVLVRAASSFDDDVVVVIVGEGPDRMYLEDLILDLRLKDKVILTGALASRTTGGTLHQLFQTADLYCLPSIDRAESFGVVLLEAMASGVPCLVSNIPGSGVTWVSEPDLTGALFCLGDPSSLSCEANRLLRDPEKLRQMRSSARARYLELFTEEVATDRILSLYEELLSARQRCH